MEIESPTTDAASVNRMVDAVERGYGGTSVRDIVNAAGAAQAAAPLLNDAFERLYAMPMAFRKWDALLGELAVSKP